MEEKSSELGWMCCLAEFAWMRHLADLGWTRRLSELSTGCARDLVTTCAGRNVVK